MKQILYILSLNLLLVWTSCGVLSKITEHAKHEVHKADSSSSTAYVSYEHTRSGDSIIHIPGTRFEAVIPFLMTECEDSIVTDQMTVKLKPVYTIDLDGTKKLKGINVKASTATKTIQPNYTSIDRGTIHLTDNVVSVVDSVAKERTVVKKTNRTATRLAIVIIGILIIAACWYVNKIIFKIKTII